MTDVLLFTGQVLLGESLGFFGLLARPVVFTLSYWKHVQLTSGVQAIEPFLDFLIQPGIVATSYSSLMVSFASFCLATCGAILKIPFKGFISSAAAWLSFGLDASLQLCSVSFPIVIKALSLVSPAAATSVSATVNEFTASSGLGSFLELLPMPPVGVIAYFTVLTCWQHSFGQLPRNRWTDTMGTTLLCLRLAFLYDAAGHSKTGYCFLFYLIPFLLIRWNIPWVNWICRRLWSLAGECATFLINHLFRPLSLFFHRIYLISWRYFCRFLSFLQRLLPRVYFLFIRWWFEPLWRLIRPLLSLRWMEVTWNTLAPWSLPLISGLFAHAAAKTVGQLLFSSSPSAALSKQTIASGLGVAVEGGFFAFSCLLLTVEACRNTSALLFPPSPSSPNHTRKIRMTHTLAAVLSGRPLFRYFSRLFGGRFLRFLEHVCSWGFHRVLKPLCRLVWRFCYHCVYRPVSFCFSFARNRPISALAGLLYFNYRLFYLVAESELLTSVIVYWNSRMSIVEHFSQISNALITRWFNYLLQDLPMLELLTHPVFALFVLATGTVVANIVFDICEDYEQRVTSSSPSSSSSSSSAAPSSSVAIAAAAAAAAGEAAFIPGSAEYTQRVRAEHQRALRFQQQRSAAVWESLVLSVRSVTKLWFLPLVIGRASLHFRLGDGLALYSAIVYYVGWCQTNSRLSFRSSLQPQARPVHHTGTNSNNRRRRDVLNEVMPSKLYIPDDCCICLEPLLAGEEEEKEEGKEEEKKPEKKEEKKAEKKEEKEEEKKEEKKEEMTSLPIQEQVDALRRKGVQVLHCGHCFHAICFSYGDQRISVCPTCRTPLSYTAAFMNNAFS